MRSRASSTTDSRGGVRRTAGAVAAAAADAADAAAGDQADRAISDRHAI